MAVVLVEQRLSPGVTPAALERALEGNAWCRELYGVRHLESFFEIGGRRDRLLCVFEAPDAEAVRSVAQRMGYRYHGLWTATRVGATP
jgi:hypothetical protein